MKELLLKGEPMQELNCCRLSSMLVFLYRYKRLRKISWRCAGFLEKGEFYSATMRKILAYYFGVEVGAYSYGTGMLPGQFPPGVKIGRYVSIAADVKVYLRNHPYKRLSTHPFFYNAVLGYVEKDTITDHSLTIGHDVWIGYGAIITPGCHHINNGAVIAAGAVVTKDVPAYAIVAGNPAKIIKYRFDEKTIAEVETSKWWVKSITELVNYRDDFLVDLENLPSKNFINSIKND